ncbi:MAG: serine hydrolase domain-containing protein [Verrucomicrobiales bacterium]
MQINGTDASEFIDSLRNRWLVPGLAIALCLDGEQSYFSSGMSSLEFGSVFDENTVMPVGSVTKTFLAHAVSLCVNKGLLALDVPVSLYVPDLIFCDPTIQANATLADFLSMRTGLDGDEEWSASAERSYESIKSVATRLQPKDGFRQKFLYSGYSISVVAMVLESVTMRKWTGILEDDFNALGIANYAFSYDQALSHGGAACGYQRSLGEYMPYPWPQGEQSRIDPAGSLCISAKDLLRWLGASAEVPETSIFFQPHMLTHFPDVPLDFWPESYGLCWGLRNYRGHKMIYHRGSDWGFRTLVAMIPDAKLKIAIVSNRHRNLLIHLLLNHFLDELLGHSYIPWEPLFEAYAKQADQE